MQRRRSRAKMKSKVSGRQVQVCSMSSISKLQFGATLMLCQNWPVGKLNLSG
jgi:hypothetical protein